MAPADEQDVPVFTGRANLGAISLSLPMIYQQAKLEGKDFYSNLSYYLEIIRNLHIRTYEYIGEFKASTNPLAFCEGGLYGGNLKPDDKVKPLLKSFTMSFGITALNELQFLHNGKSLVEDNQFSLEVMEFINERIDSFKQEDKILYAIYSTPAESLASLQCTQFKNKYGEVEGVTDKPYFTNSFHCHVSENISPIQKQDREKEFWNLTKGGRIQYVKYTNKVNKEAFRTLVRRAMKMGFYEGVNLSLSYCGDCGHEQLKMKVCPKCGSKRMICIDRLCGYLGYTEINGSSRMNEGKQAEVADRVSM